jgi:hypothetical protein
MKFLIAEFYIVVLMKFALVDTYGASFGNPGLFSNPNVSQITGGTSFGNPGLFSNPNVSQSTSGTSFENPGLYSNPNVSQSTAGPSTLAEMESLLQSIGI